MPHISERDSQLPKLEFPKIFKRVITDKSVISLGPGEPDFVTPKPLLDYAGKMLSRKEGTHYSEPQGMLELREAIAKKALKENGIKTNPDNILITCGSQEALFSSLLTAIDATEEVIVPSPGYVGYLPAIELVNGVPKFLELKEEENWEVNLDELKRIVNKKKTKVIIINSPSNPTGNVLSRNVLEGVADIAVENDCYVFSDEAYEKIVYNGKKNVSIGSLNGMEKYAVTFQSFSKTYAMCGFRVGYCLGPRKFIEEVAQDHHYVTLCAPHLSQIVAAKALALSKKHIDSMVKEYKRRRDFIVPRLNEMGLSTVMPNGAFYAFSNIGRFNKSSSRFARLLLEKAKVAVIPGTEFGPFGEGYVRCSFATEYEKIEIAMERVGKFLKGLRHHK